MCIHDIWEGTEKLWLTFRFYMRKAKKTHQPKFGDKNSKDNDTIQNNLKNNEMISSQNFQLTLSIYFSTDNNTSIVNEEEMGIHEGGVIKPPFQTFTQFQAWENKMSISGRSWRERIRQYPWDKKANSINAWRKTDAKSISLYKA